MKATFYALIIAAFLGLFWLLVDLLGLYAVILLAAVFTGLFAGLDPQDSREA
jgi:hypothetical protein